VFLKNLLAICNKGIPVDSDRNCADAGFNELRDFGRVRISDHREMVPRHVRDRGIHGKQARPYFRAPRFRQHQQGPAGILSWLIDLRRMHIAFKDLKVAGLRLNRRARRQQSKLCRFFQLRFQRKVSRIEVDLQVSQVRKSSIEIRG